MGIGEVHFPHPPSEQPGLPRPPTKAPGKLII